MLGLLFYMGGWVDGWMASTDSQIILRFEMGPDDRPKRSAWMSIETSACLGHVTVWESGEVDAEVVEVASGASIRAISRVVGSPSELAATIREVISAAS